MDVLVQFKEKQRARWAAGDYGRIAIQAWKPDSGVAHMFSLIARYQPPSVSTASPFAWGARDQVSELLAPFFRDLHFAEGDCVETAESAAALAEFFIRHFGPVRQTYQSLSQDEAQAFRCDLTALYQQYVPPADNRVRWGREYLVALGIRRG